MISQPNITFYLFQIQSKKESSQKLLTKDRKLIYSLLKQFKQEESKKINWSYRSTNKTELAENSKDLTLNYLIILLYLEKELPK